MPGTRATTKEANALSAGDLQGTGRLVVQAVEAVTHIVEDMHRHIARVSPIVGTVPPGRTRGITGLVYRSVRGVNKVVGLALDAALSQLGPLLHGRGSLPRREAVLAGLNGVLGDYLQASGNPLAIPMQLRQHGRPLVMADQNGGKLLVLVHGLCMNDLQWLRQGHDHGAGLALSLGYTPLYLHYNTGRPIAANGQALADTLEQLIKDWPVPVTELAIVGHSMGGLVARSACHVAAESKHAWLRRLKKLVFLGTPHQGAPLERAGNWVDTVLGVSPYTAPLARLGAVRSAGIKDLRHGRFVADGGPTQAAWLPKGVKCFAVAATRQARPARPAAGSDPAFARLAGDGLVPVRSALGLHTDEAQALALAATRRRVFYGLDHFDLLSSAELGQQLQRWLA